MKTIKKIPKNNDDIFAAIHRMATKINELVDNMNQLASLVCKEKLPLEGK